jgi:hypothetical protein
MSQNHTTTISILKGMSESMADTEPHIFSIDGFLSLQVVVTAASSQPDATKQAAALCIDLNRLSLKRLQEIKLNAENTLSALLAAQATTSFESSVILASIGMDGGGSIFGEALC